MFPSAHVLGSPALWTEGSHVQTAGTLAAPKESLETREGQRAISQSLAVVEATSTGSLSHRLPASLEVIISLLEGEGKRV